MVQAAQRRQGAGSTKAPRAAVKTRGRHSEERPVAFSCLAWLFPPLAAVFGVLLAQAARSPGGISQAVLGMPVAAFVYGRVLGPVGGPLERWLWQHGGWTNGYVTTFDDGGRGVVAAYDLRPGDRVMHVPKHLFLHLPRSWARRAGALGESEEESRDRAQAHALGSLASRLEGEREKMADSKWSVWVQAMMRPTDGSKAPFNSVLWPAEALPLIRALLPYYMRQVDEILRQGGSRQFLDAVRHVISRYYGGDVADGDAYLVPVADFLNHVSPRHATARVRRLDGEGGFVVEAIASISAGEQIMVTYGMLPNTHLLAAYGFSLPQNAMSSQVFFVEGGPSGSDGHCQRTLGLGDLFENGQLHLGEARARVNVRKRGVPLRPLGFE